MVYKVSAFSVNLYTAADYYGIQDDLIVVTDNNGQTVQTYSGDDIVDATAAAPASSFSVLNVLLGAGNDEFIGHSGKDYVFDGSGDDVIDLAFGDDVIYADVGNDQYYGGNGIDTVDLRNINVKGGSSSSSSPTHGVTLDLAKTTAQNLGERGTDLFSGFENVIGTEFADKFYGNALTNVMTGDFGNDALDGRGGNDTLLGGFGQDVLIGGTGKDTLDGKNGGTPEFTAAKDLFKYNAFNESGIVAATADEILNFDKGGLAIDDRIDLSKLDGNTALAGDQALLFRGYAASFGTNASGEVRLATVGADTYVIVDSNATSDAEMLIIVKNVTGLAATDFLL